jgi:hypothetical protein
VIQTEEKNKLLSDARDRRVSDMQKREEEIKEQITKLESDLLNLQSEIVKAVDEKYEFSDEMTISAAKDSLKSLESKREMVFTFNRAGEVRAELSVAIHDAEILDNKVKKLTKEVPEDLIKKAKLPNEGLTIAEYDILVNGVNIDSLSPSEQLKFGLDVVRALNGEFKVICIDGIEKLDKESFEAFLKEIENDSFQYFVTRVDGTNEHSIVVDNGEIIKAV